MCHYIRCYSWFLCRLELVLTFENWLVKHQHWTLVLPFTRSLHGSWAEMTGRQGVVLNKIHLVTVCVDVTHDPNVVPVGVTAPHT